MKDKIKDKANKVKEHLTDHKWTYFWATAAILLWNGQSRNIREFDKFMTEKGIDPLEFWNPEWYDEKISEKKGDEA